MEAVPTPLVSLFAAYTLTDGEVLVSSSDFDPVYAAGQSLLRRPKHQGSFTLRAGSRSALGRRHRGGGGRARRQRLPRAWASPGTRATRGWMPACAAASLAAWRRSSWPRTCSTRNTRRRWAIRPWAARSARAFAFASGAPSPAVTARERVLLAWSSGKDSAFSLHVLRQTEDVEVVGLLTTINEAFDRVAMHAVRHTLLRAQAEAVGLPLQAVGIPWPCPNDVYEKAMAAALEEARARDITAVAFGDLFLEDVRRYREERLAGTGLRPLFPLWGRDTRALAEEMIASGQKAVLTCVDPRVLPPSFAGRAFDESLLRDLPAGRRSLRRERRVPQLRVGRPRVPASGAGAGRRGGDARRLRLRGPSADVRPGREPSSSPLPRGLLVATGPRAARLRGAAARAKPQRVASINLSADEVLVGHPAPGAPRLRHPLGRRARHLERGGERSRRASSASSSATWSSS